MREIKFRGKAAHDNPTCKKGVWVYGGLAFIEGIRWIIQVDREMWVDKTTVKFTAIEVIPETIGQYTGLKDKNGKEIYEGDIVDYYDAGLDKSMQPNRTTEIRWSKDKCYCFVPDQNCSVIGNIHENPELLEKA